MALLKEHMLARLKKTIGSDKVDIPNIVNLVFLMKLSLLVMNLALNLTMLVPLAPLWRHRLSFTTLVSLTSNFKYRITFNNFPISLNKNCRYQFTPRSMVAITRLLTLTMVKLEKWPEAQFLLPKLFCHYFYSNFG